MSVMGVLDKLDTGLEVDVVVDVEPRAVAVAAVASARRLASTCST